MDQLGGGGRAVLGDDDVEGTGALAVESHVLGEGLADGDVEIRAGGAEVADGPGVVVEVSRGEALVGRVEDDEELLFSADLREGLPLLLGRVHARGVVGARVEQDGVVLLHVVAEGAHGAVKVEDGLGCVVVWVGGLLDRGGVVSPDVEVVHPRRVGQPDVARTDSLFAHHGDGAVGSRAGDGLHGGNALLGGVDDFIAKDERLRRLKEDGISAKREVFVRRVVNVQLLLRLRHRRQLPRLLLVIAVGANNEIDLSRVRVSKDSAELDKGNIGLRRLERSKVASLLDRDGARSRGVVGTGDSHV